MVNKIMTDMIERVAKAINDAMLQHGDYKPDELARVAIAAMREPTKEMEAMGCGWWAYHSEFGRMELPAVYTRMIDAALEVITKTD